MSITESYNKLINTLNHYIPVVYTKQVRAMVEVLDKDYISKLAQEAAIQTLQQAHPSQDKPSVEIVLGYPGAGKTTVEHKIQTKYNGNIINADFDNFRQFDSRLFSSIRQNPLNADFFTQVPAEIRKKLLRQVSSEKKNVIISAPHLPLFDTNKYSIFSTFGSDYNINITYIAANQHLCCLSNFTRYYSAMLNNLDSDKDFVIPRLLSPKDHQNLSNGTKQNVFEITKKLNNKQNFNFEIVDREGNTLWKKGDIRQIIPTIKKRENAPLTFEETKRLQYELEYINMAINKIGISNKEARMLDTFLKGHIKNLSLTQDRKLYMCFNKNKEGSHAF